MFIPKKYEDTLHVAIQVTTPYLHLSAVFWLTAAGSLSKGGVTMGPWGAAARRH